MSELIERQAAIDECNKRGAEHIGYAIAHLPTVQPEERTEKRTEMHGVCLDAVSRQAAIDIERNATVDTNPSHFEAHQKFTQFMDDAEISSFGRWQWSNGFNTALTAVGIDLKKLPTIQPEPKWIPVERELPEDRKSVIVCYRCWLQFSKKFAYAIVIGWHASKFSVKAEVFTEWDGDFDYNEEQDENYIPEGWYEFTTQGNGDLMDWYIDAEVIAWMPLPTPYTK